MTANRLAPVPRGVRAVMPGGEVIPLELVCLGWRRSKWRWMAAWPLRELPERLDHDWMPDDTMILVKTVRHGA